MTDYYKILGIPPSASKDEIKKAFRRCALQYHPDKNIGDKTTDVKFIEIKIAYEILYDTVKRKEYDLLINLEKQAQTKNEKQNNQKTQQGSTQTVTPETFLGLFVELLQKIASVDSKKINQTWIIERIANILTDDVIGYLLSRDVVKVNNSIIQFALKCCDPLDSQNFDKICPKLVRLAGVDNSAIQSIFIYSKKKKTSENWKFYKSIIAVSAVVFIIVFMIFVNSNGSTTNSTDNTPSNGDLNSSFVTPVADSQKVDKEKTIQVDGNKYVKSTVVNKLTPEQLFEQEKESLQSEGWNDQDINNGQFPDCYNYKPKFGKNNCYLDVKVGGGTDIAIKIMDANTEMCIRYVFINSGSTYRINHLPEGEYYLKIAYGKNWMSKVIDGQCQGKFIRNPMYEKGDNILDCNLTYTENSVQTPYFRLSLDVIASDISNSFNAKSISENEFNE